MPAESEKQAVMMRIAEHHPEKLYERNKGAAEMSHSQLHDFAKTKDKGLPTYAHARAARRKQE
jgi:hypothetical protein